MAETQSLEMKSEDSANAPDIGQVTAIQKPEWVPDKFYDAKTGVINFEAITKGYGELERKQSAAAPPKADETPNGETEKPQEKAPEQKPLDIPAIPGVKPESLKEYTEELQTKGALSEKSYADLQAAGYPKAMVDAYVKGLRSDSIVQESVQAARIADKEIEAMKAEVGGDASLKEMQKWAVSSLSEKQLAAYNAAVSSPDVETVRLAVNGLHRAFTKANGTGENLLHGQNSGVNELDVFESRAEQSAAINNPLYQKDPAYRARVSAKIGRSKV
jgi:hypothetical protein